MTITMENSQRMTCHPRATRNIHVHVMHAIREFYGEKVKAKKRHAPACRPHVLDFVDRARVQSRVDGRAGTWSTSYMYLNIKNGSYVYMHDTAQSFMHNSNNLKKSTPPLWPLKLHRNNMSTVLFVTRFSPSGHLQHGGEII